MQCNGCTLCCYLLDVPEINKPAETECKDCAVNVGCKIWKNRPQVCRDFECAYVQMKKVSPKLRPDNCKVIFEKISDRIFYGTQDPRFAATEVAKKQVAAFINQGFSVIIVVPHQSQNFFIAKHHDEEDIRREFKQILNQKYGSSDLQHRFK